MNKDISINARIEYLKKEITKHQDEIRKIEDKIFTFEDYDMFNSSNSSFNWKLGRLRNFEEELQWLEQLKGFLDSYHETLINEDIEMNIDEYFGLEEIILGYSKKSNNAEI